MRARRLVFPVLALALALPASGLAVRSVARADAQATDANVTRLTTGLLEHSQLARRPFDAALARALLDRYMDSLDGSRSLFLQSDADAFEADGATLAAGTRATGDTRAARAVFDRYLERLAQRTAFLTAALRTGTFDFTGHDTYSFDREHAPRPADLAAAHALWLGELRAEYLQAKLDPKRSAPIAGTLIRRYARELRTMKALGPDDVLAIYLDALAHVYDPHSDYMGREQTESFSIAMNLSLFGIGATLESKDGYCTIRDLVPGGPAARSGLLKSGDRIVAVSQPGRGPVDVVNIPLSRAVELIRGSKGSTVKLAVLPAGAAAGAAPKTVAIVRDQVKLEDQEARARIVDLPLPTPAGATVRLGVVDLPSFYADMGGGGGDHRSATADVARLLGKLKAERVQGVLLDLRRNGGGSLEEAIHMTGLFIRKGPVVQTRDAEGHVEVGADDDASVAYDGPLVVLTSRLSASASEILAGALQDYGRALVVGDARTFGKGTVQNVLPLGPLMDRLGLAHAYDPGTLKITTNKFYRPSGASTQLRGVASDVVVPSTSDVDEVGESALKDALPWDVVPPARYERLDRVRPYVDELRARSARRIAGEKDFTFLEGDAARLREDLATKSVSLNESERRQELAQDEARRADRTREERALRASAPTTYAITLENVSSPGLPPPVAATSDAGAPRPADAAPGNDAASDAPSAYDIVLDEGEHVLADYVGLLAARAPGGGARATVTDRRAAGPRIHVPGA